MGEAD